MLYREVRDILWPVITSAFLQNCSCVHVCVCVCFCYLLELISGAGQKKLEENRRFEAVRPQAAAPAKPPVPKNTFAKNLHEMYCPKVREETGQRQE